MRLMNLGVIWSLPLLAVIANFNTTCGQYERKIAAASNAGEAALKSFQIPKGMQAELFVAEPLLANPVDFCIDEQGRVYVAETFRQKKGVEDNRSHMNWLHDDLALQTVEERVAMFKKHLGDKALEYTKEHDRIRLLTDTDGDGKADKAIVFVDGFNNIADGTGAGVLAIDGDVYYTCYPEGLEVQGQRQRRRRRYEICFASWIRCSSCFPRSRLAWPDNGARWTSLFQYRRPGLQR